MAAEAWDARSLTLDEAFDLRIRPRREFHATAADRIVPAVAEERPHHVIKGPREAIASLAGDRSQHRADCSELGGRDARCGGGAARDLFGVDGYGADE